MHRALLLSLLLLFASSVNAANEPTLKAGVFSPPRKAPEFSLLGSDGQALNLGRYRGKVVVLGFGFTSCADVCPVTLAVLAQARKKLGAAGKDVQIVYITVDPERDDAKRMKEYLTVFDPTFVGGTGTAQQLAPVYKEYGIIANKVASKGAKKPTATDYSIAHSSYTYLIDKQGVLRALMPYGHDAADYEHDFRILLRSET